tara:strand:- start:856 stop:1047 length:192 start_codon:yes stop_codon:yes gene_type:complete
MLSAMRHTVAFYWLAKAIGVLTGGLKIESAIKHARRNVVYIGHIAVLEMYIVKAGNTVGQLFG